MVPPTYRMPPRGKEKEKWGDGKLDRVRKKKGTGQFIRKITPRLNAVPGGVSTNQGGKARRGGKTDEKLQKKKSRGKGKEGHKKKL